MNCPQCGEQWDAHVKFCPKCGTKLQEDNVQQEAAVIDGIPASTKWQTNALILKLLPVLKRPSTWVLFSVFCAFIIAIILFLRPASPEAVAEKFMKALSSGNYAKAYGMLYQQGASLESQDEFIKAQEALENALGPIKEYRIDFREEERRLEEAFGKMINDTEYSKSKRQDYIVTFSRAKMGQPMKFTLSVINVSSTGRPEWRVYVPELYGEYAVYIPKISNCTVSVNGKELVPQDGVLRFRAFKGNQYQVVIQGPDIKTVQLALDDNKPSQKLETFPVSDDLQAKLEKVIEGFNNADIQACMDWNMEYYRPYLKYEKGGWLSRSKWEEMEARIENLKNMGRRVKSNLVRVNYERGTTSEDGRAKIKVTETWESQTIGSDGNVIETRPAHTIVWLYHLERQPDGNWLIIDNDEVYQ